MGGQQLAVQQQCSPQPRPTPKESSPLMLLSMGYSTALFQECFPVVGNWLSTCDAVQGWGLAPGEALPQQLLTKSPSPWCSSGWDMSSQAGSCEAPPPQLLGQCPHSALMARVHSPNVAATGSVPLGRCEFRFIPRQVFIVAIVRYQAEQIGFVDHSISIATVPSMHSWLT